MPVYNVSWGSIVHAEGPEDAAMHCLSGMAHHEWWYFGARSAAGHRATSVRQACREHPRSPYATRVLSGVFNDPPPALPTSESATSRPFHVVHTQTITSSSPTLAVVRAMYNIMECGARYFTVKEAGESERILWEGQVTPEMYGNRAEYAGFLSADYQEE